MNNEHAGIWESLRAMGETLDNLVKQVQELEERLADVEAKHSEEENVAIWGGGMKE